MKIPSPVCTCGTVLTLLSLLALFQTTTARKVAGVPHCVCT